MEPKSPWMSRTFWINVLTLALNGLTVAGLVIVTLLQQDFIKDHAEAVAWLTFTLGIINSGVAVANTILRWAGNAPLTKLLIWLVMLSLVAMPAVAQADDVAVLIDDSKPGTYLLTVGADKSVSVNPIRVVRPGANPVPIPNPPPGTIQAKVKVLAQEAIAGGGTQETAAALSAVYSFVSGQIEAGVVPLAQAMPAVKFLSDQVIPTAEIEKWAKFRTGIAVLTAEQQQAGQFGTKAQISTALKAMSEGIKSAANSTAAANGRAIDWENLFKLLLPILLRLLEKWLAGGMAP